MITRIVITVLVLSLIGYTLIGTSERVDEIRKLAPSGMEARNWKILRYEGYQYGSWSNHGGKVWYHVANVDNPNIQYRVYITMWDGELQYTYGQPEKLNRIDIEGDPSVTIQSDQK
jgi:hypothetical protein